MPYLCLSKLAAIAVGALHRSSETYCWSLYYIRYLSTASNNSKRESPTNTDCPKLSTSSTEPSPNHSRPARTATQGLELHPYVLHRLSGTQDGLNSGVTVHIRHSPNPLTFLGSRSLDISTGRSEAGPRTQGCACSSHGNRLTST